MNGTHWNWAFGVALGVAASGCTRGHDRAPEVPPAVAAWDQDEDGLLSEREYQAGVDDAGLFKEFDTDDNGYLTSDELRFGLFEAWDQNNDTLLTEEEFARGSRQWFGSEDRYGTFAAGDANGDRLIGYDEFLDHALRIHAGWNQNADPLLDAREFSSGLFEDQDQDDDGSVRDNEFGLPID